MTDKKMNFRSHVTKMMLQESLIDILKEKSLREITITEICKKSKVDRSTFYLHYKDIFDILQNVKKDLCDRLISTLDKTSIDEDIHNYISVYNLEVLNFIFKNSKLFEVLLNDINDKILILDFSNIVRKKCIETCSIHHQNINQDEFADFFTFVIFGCMGLLEKWCKNGMQETPQDMDRKIRKFITQIRFL